MTLYAAPLLNHPLNKDFKGFAFNGVQGQSPWPFYPPGPKFAAWTKTCSLF
jgi:hypothetical protein